MTNSSSERGQGTSILSSSARRTPRWSWRTALGGVDRGKRVWDQAFGSLRPRISARRAHVSRACCGACSTANWRLRGEARRAAWCRRQEHQRGQLIGNIGDQPIGDRQAEFVAGYARLIAEIRARQPQAKFDLAALSTESVASRGVAHGRGCERRGVQEARRRQHRLLRQFRRPLFPSRRLPRPGHVDHPRSSKRGNTRARL